MSKSACQTPCQLASCFFIFLTHFFFSSFPFLFFFFFFFALQKTCQSGNWCNVCMQIISASNWVEGKNLIFEVPCCSLFFFFLLLARIKTLFITYKMIFATPKFVEAMCARGLSQIVANIGNLNETNFSNPCKLVLDHTTI